MNDLISRQEALDAIKKYDFFFPHPQYMDWFMTRLRDTMKADLINDIKELPSAEPDKRIAKIEDLVEGTIDHFDLDDAMDLLYQIKGVLK